MVTSVERDSYLDTPRPMSQTSGIVILRQCPGLGQSRLFVILAETEATAREVSGNKSGEWWTTN
jgi:hypothetical protein